jgi:predicted glycosyltransferase
VSTAGESGHEGLRFLLYGHDTYGLGHIRRNTAVGSRLVKDFTGSSGLLLTGSPLAHCFFLPNRLDYVKIPSVTKDSAGRYRARHLHLSLEEITSLREVLIQETALTFRPDIFIVDHSPAGMTDEIRSTLTTLRENLPQTQLVLGLRDIIDDPAKVRRVWHEQGIYHLLDNVYDLIMVYGQRSICDVSSEYGISGPAEKKIKYTGYIRREESVRPREDVRWELGLRTDRLVVLTVGGGEDGFPIVRKYLEGLKVFGGTVPFDTVIFTGPFMTRDDRVQIISQSDLSWPVRIMDFTGDFLSFLNAADVIVSMGGYNTVCEILSLGKPAVIIPRIYPRVEQLLRAQRMSDFGLFKMVHPGSLNPKGLMKEVLSLLDGQMVPRTLTDNQGLNRVSGNISELISTARSPLEVG